MIVGIIGSGMIGSTVARLAVGGGNKVVIGNSRGPNSLRDLIAELGPRAKAGTAAEAVAAGDMVLLAVPFRYRDSLFKSGVNFRGKIVIDATNPYAPDMSILDLGGRGSSEIVAEELPGARIVKAFNTLYFETLLRSARPKGSSERIVIPIAGDDAEAKRSVAAFIDSIGYDVLDMGSLKEGRKQQPNTAFYNRSLTADQAKALV